MDINNYDDKAISKHQKLVPWNRTDACLSVFIFVLILLTIAASPALLVWLYRSAA